MTIILLVSLLGNLTAIVLLGRRRNDASESAASFADITSKLDRAADATTTAAEILRTALDTDRVLAMQDRAVSRSSNEAVLRIEVAAAGVAVDLAAAHERADAADGPHGAAADAAMKTVPELT